MANTLDKIEVVTEFAHLQIRELTDAGGYHRKTLTCDQTLAEDEHQEVKDKAEQVWTDEVKTAWTTFQAEQQALNNPE
tara:strand:- start:476 stop:709 length:234 start_codon:yes stop_codon:yes gene_type:complete